MSDLIERQAVLKICRRYWHPTFNPIMEEVEKLPSAQPQRKVARWEILYPNHTYKYHCSECGANHKYMFDFCPSCGAYMGDESE